MNKPLFALGISLLLLGIGMLYGVSAVAHPGGLDANGCHNNNALGKYECHTGEFAGTVWPSRDEFEIVNIDPSIRPPDPDPEVYPDWDADIQWANQVDWSTLKKYEANGLFFEFDRYVVRDGDVGYVFEIAPSPTEVGAYVLRMKGKVPLGLVTTEQLSELFSNAP